MLLPIIQTLLIITMIALEAFKSSLSDTGAIWADRIRWAITVLGLIVTIVVLSYVSSKGSSLTSPIDCALTLSCPSPTP